MINNKDGKQTPKMSAPVDYDISQNAEENSSPLPKRADTPGIERNLVRKTNGSRAPQIYEK